ncbi:unnamed protein product, partial [Rotaria magnacalcarata]
HLVQHVIANANNVYASNDIVITALYAVCWIDSAWKFITETTLRNTFRQAAFDTTVVSLDPILTQTIFANEDNAEHENKCLHDLDKVLKHVTIGGNVMSVADFVSVDEDVPVFNQWNGASEKRLGVDGISNDDIPNDDIPNDDDLVLEPPPSLSESMKMIRRLHLLSTR